MQKKEIYKISDDLKQVLVSASKGFLSSEQFDMLVSSIESEAAKYYFDSSSESNLIRVINSMFDSVSFLTEAAHYPHHLEIVIALTANSNYLTDIIVRNPEYLYQLFDTDFLASELKFGKLNEVTNKGLSRYKSFNAKVNFLRMLKRRIMLKIGLTDILGVFPLLKITEDISLLAKVICAELLNLCFAEVCKKYNSEPEYNRYTLCSLGKMGGDELNYSSDVDFILFYDKNNIVNEDGTEFYEILSEATRLFIQEAMELTERGFLYRVDFRLRPDGKNSPLCRTLTDYLKYYEVKGEDWERQMLLKLGFVTGSKELYNHFRSFLKGFIFPSVFMNSPMQQIRKMRRKIEERSAGTDNIKTFRGGIRDIEFSVQAIQLLNGKRLPDIVSGNSLYVLKGLLKNNLISQGEYNTYSEAYIFYRKIEHYLQLMNDNQTHVIPEKGEIPAKMAAYLGFSSEVSFREELGRKQNNVRAVYNDIMNVEEVTEQPAEPEHFIKFENPKTAQNNLLYLATGTGLLGQKEFDKRTMDLFAEIKPELYKYLTNHPAPDFVLEQFTRMIQTVSFRSIWYQEFKNIDYFITCLKICDYASVGNNYFRVDKTLGEMLLSRKVFIKNLFEHYNDLSLSQISFILSVQFALKLIDNRTFSGILSGYINNALQRKIWQYDFEYEYFIISLGSSAVGDMHFGSDLDLIVVAKDTNKHAEIHSHFQKFLNETKAELAPFEIDFKLRPEGKNAPLVTDMASFEKYLEKRAQIWEFQAFQKMKFITGSKHMYEALITKIAERVKKFDENKLRIEIKGMHKRFVQQASSGFTKQVNIKKGKGTLVTIDFLLQYIFLTNSNLFLKALNKNIPERIAMLQHYNEKYKNIDKLTDCYNFYKYLEITNQNLFNQRSSAIPTDKFKQKRLATFMGYKSFDELNSEIIKKKKIVNEVFEHFLG